MRHVSFLEEVSRERVLIYYHLDVRLFSGIFMLSLTPPFTLHLAPHRYSNTLKSGTVQGFDFKLQ